MEDHKKQFRGVWISPEIMEMVENKAISIKEGWLLIIIDSLVQYGSEDCFASNKYLSKRIAVSEDRVCKMISHLKKEKLLVQTGFDGRKRYLKTAWSRLEIPKQGRRKRRSRVGENAEADENTLYMNNNKINNKVNNSPTSDEDVTDSPSKTLKKQHPRWKTFARKLANAIKLVKKVNCNSKSISWAKQFELLHKRDKVAIPRIRKVLTWYCKELEAPDTYTPVAESGKAFREKFIRIEDAMKRATVYAATSSEPEDIEAKEAVMIKNLIDYIQERAKTEPNLVNMENELGEKTTLILAYTYKEQGELDFGDWTPD